MKKLKVLSMAMISLFALTGCDVEMDLDKTNAEAPIVLEDGATTYGNKLQEIYDSVVNYGDTNSQRILNNILFAYAQIYFGEFYKLNQLVDESNVNAIKEFKAFAAKEGETDADVLVRAKIFRNSILTAIKKDFWNSVKNGSYQNRQTFIEEKFVDAQKANLYNMIEPAAYEDTYDKHAINGSKTYEDVGDYYVGGLGTYQLDGSDVTNGTGILGRYSDYIRRSLMPDMYRKALVERYVIDNNYGTLGRSYARKVQYVSVPNIDGYPEATRNLVRKYCQLVLAKEDDDPSFGGKGEVYKNLHFLDRLFQGYFPDETERAFAETIYKAAGFEAFTTTAEGFTTDATPNANGYAYSYIKDSDTYVSYQTWANTTYGNLVADYSKLTDSRWETGSSTDFTNSGTYTVETGLKIKTADIVAGSKVTEGWYTSSGLNDLQSDLKSRLFKVNVANQVDYNLEQSQAKFVRYVGGHYYLLPDSYQTADQFPYAIYDASGSTYYIVRVDEAVKPGKMATVEDDNDYAYINESYERLQQVVWDVVNLIADGDSYVKAAKQYFVSEMKVSFHDDDVYNYFKNTFPDLFD